MSYNVETLVVEAQPCLTVAKRAARADLVSTMLAGIGEVWDRVRTEGIKPVGRNVAIYRGGDADFVDLEAGVELLSGHGLPPDEVTWTPAGQAVFTAHVGPYQGIPDAHAAVVAWCRETGVEFAGPSWEIYGHWNEDESKLTTELFYLLTSAPNRT